MSTISTMSALAQVDPAVFEAIQAEERRQRDGLELIAAENYVSAAVREAMSCVMTNKYAEGYPGRRYYGGCEHVDVAENLARERVTQLFDAQYANVQPHSGSQANMAVYFALLQPGDTILGLDLSHGGHLTHGRNVNFSGIFFNAVGYLVDPETERIDMDRVRAAAQEHQPKLIVAGGSAYSRHIDFAAFRAIADEVGAYLMVDMAHFAGLVAGDVHPTPVPHAHVVTSTTHKTLRGPRGGFILSNDEETAKKFDKMIFPGIQGGPLMHIIAAKAVAFKEAAEPAFTEYAAQVCRNAKRLAAELTARNFRICTGGTDTHLLLVDLRPRGLTGKAVQNTLDEAGITTNKNTIPYDPEKPFVTSGVRLGTPALTSRGMGEEEMATVAALIDEALRDGADLPAVRAKVEALCANFPVPGLDS